MRVIDIHSEGRVYSLSGEGDKYVNRTIRGIFNDGYVVHEWKPGVETYIPISAIQRINVRASEDIPQEP